MLILASKSPRRKELLSIITQDFEIIPAVGEENADPALPPEKFVEALAIAKAEEVAASHPDDTIIGSDTVVAVNGEILGKPRDKADAFRMLSLLSGTKHSVFTGVAIVKDGKTHSFTEETNVKFFDLSEKEIEDYIATGEPFDKAGAYGIQELGALLVEGIDGDYYNVMGLPTGRLFRLMKELEIV